MRTTVRDEELDRALSLGTDYAGRIMFDDLVTALREHRHRIVSVRFLHWLHDPNANYEVVLQARW